MKLRLFLLQVSKSYILNYLSYNRGIIEQPNSNNNHTGNIGKQHQQHKVLLIWAPITWI